MYGVFGLAMRIVRQPAQEILPQLFPSALASVAGGGTGSEWRAPAEASSAHSATSSCRIVLLLKTNRSRETTYLQLAGRGRPLLQSLGADIYRCMARALKELLGAFHGPSVQSQI